MGDNSDLSDACLSGSEDDGVLDQHEYERKRELYMSKMIFCEKKFLELKPILLKLKLAEVIFKNLIFILIFLDCQYAEKIVESNG